MRRGRRELCSLTPILTRSDVLRAVCSMGHSLPTAKWLVLCFVKDSSSPNCCLLQHLPAALAHDVSHSSEYRKDLQFILAKYPSVKSSTLATTSEQKSSEYKQEIVLEEGDTGERE
jgi:hypothetical protein